MVSSTALQEYSSAEDWVSPWVHPKLDRQGLHVWRASLLTRSDVIERLEEYLSQDERARAEAFAFEVHRRAFIIARGWLRVLLGRYLETGPASIRFGYEKHGKPFIAEIGKKGPLHFNVSHSGNVALYAFTRLCCVGIDLELKQPGFSGDEMCARLFAPSEVATLALLPTNLRADGFFNYWTCKEAFIKAKGAGLSLGLDQFEVNIGATESPLVLRTAWDEAEAARWSLIQINAGKGYAAAVALAAHDWRLSRWQVDEQSLPHELLTTPSLTRA